MIRDTVSDKRDGKMTEDIKISKLNSGDKLYHYTSAEGLMGISNGEIWITEKSFLNDSTEFKIANEVFGDIIDEKIENEQERTKIKEAVMKEAKSFDSSSDMQKTDLHDGYYVLSFCLEKDSMLMWSQYSDFIGYCMEFDYDKLIESLKQYIIKWEGKVIYNSKEQKECLEKTIQEFIFDNMEDCPDINSWKDLIKIVNENKDDVLLFIVTILAVYSMFFKKSCFAGEKEYRIIFSCIHNGTGKREKLSEKQYFRAKDEVLIPFVKKKFEPDISLESILVGPKNNSDLAVKGLKYFFRNKKMNINISKSEIPLRY